MKRLGRNFLNERHLLIVYINYTSTNSAFISECFEIVYSRIQDQEYGRYSDSFVENERGGQPVGGLFLELFPTNQQTRQSKAIQVSFIQNIPFGKRKRALFLTPHRIQHLGVEEAISNGEPNFLEKSTSVKLQLIVLCPSFLEFVSGNPEECKILGKILLSDRTLALLLGVHDSDLQEVHKNALATYSQWQRQSVGQDQDSNFTKEFLSQAMAILSRVWKQQSSVVSQEKAQFTVTPKKIRQVSRKLGVQSEGNAFIFYFPSKLNFVEPVKYAVAN